ncbi:MAG: peptidase M15 [Magnetococcales bacterium]|nr:peptidase M15 [Magnetococcales bacterium]MBF0115647.1 peptidase M15 [Magnetococcales bacterium]
MPGNTQWPHFSEAELACHCGCGRQEMEDSFMIELEKLRTAFGQPMVVTSGFRCPNYNMQASHTGPCGPHTTGKAVDIQISGADAHRLLTLALQQGCFTGIGVSQAGPHNTRFLHLDTIEPSPGRPRPTVWTY